MKIAKQTYLATFSICAAMFATSCEVEQTEEGEMPEIRAEGGKLPEYDVQTGDVEVGTKEKTITVPTVDVQSPAEERAEEKAEERIEQNQ